MLVLNILTGSGSVWKHCICLGVDCQVSEKPELYSKSQLHRRVLVQRLIMTAGFAIKIDCLFWLKLSFAVGLCAAVSCRSATFNWWYIPKFFILYIPSHFVRVWFVSDGKCIIVCTLFISAIANSSLVRLSLSVLRESFWVHSWLNIVAAILW